MSTDPSDMFRRIFEAHPIDWHHIFRVEAQVKLIRSHPFWSYIPVGAIGTIESIDLQSGRSRPVIVEFELTDYRILLSEEMQNAIRNAGFEVPEFHSRITTECSPNDLAIVDESE